MLSLKDKLNYLIGRIADRYRLVGKLIFTDIELTFCVLGHIAYSQKITDQHEQYVAVEAKLWQLSEEKTRQANQYFLMGGKLVTEAFEASLRDFKGNKLAQEKLLSSCWRMIWADRHLGVREYQVVHLFGYWLGWERSMIERLGIPFRPVYITQKHQEALTLLDIKLDSSIELIKQKYKRQLSIYHPDKVIGAGGSDDDVFKANELTIKIQEAYALIRMLHNF